MTSIKYYYDLIRNGSIETIKKEIIDRDVAFSEFILKRAMADFEYDVVKKLLDNGVPITYPFFFQFKTKKTNNSKILNEPDDLVFKKFELIDLLNQKGHKHIIPEYLQDKWNEWKKLEDDDARFPMVYYYILVGLILLFIQKIL